jgi:hypothetical protein
MGHRRRFRQSLVNSGNTALPIRCAVACGDGVRERRGRVCGASIGVIGSTRVGVVEQRHVWYTK